MVAAVAVVIVAGAVWVIARQLKPRPISRFSLLTLPALLAFLAWRSAPTALAPAQSLELAATLAVAVAGGLWQAAATQVFARDGTWWMRGGSAYLLGWAVLLAARLALRLAFEGPAGAWGPAAVASLWMTYLDAAVAWGMRSAAVYLRNPEIGVALARR